MTGRSDRTETMQALRAQRDALQATKRAVAEWASKQQGHRDVVAAAMLELLSECTSDKNGDKTLDIVSDLFDEYADVLAADRANALAHAIGHLGVAAQVLGRRRSMRVER